MKYIPKSLGLDLIADRLSEILSVAFLVVQKDVFWFGSWKRQNLRDNSVACLDDLTLVLPSSGKTSSKYWALDPPSHRLQGWGHFLTCWHFPLQSSWLAQTCEPGRELQLGGKRLRCFSSAQLLWGKIMSYEQVKADAADTNVLAHCRKMKKFSTWSPLCILRTWHIFCSR